MAKKTLLDIEQLVAGAFLYGFDRVSNLDIRLITSDFKNKYPEYHFDYGFWEYMSKYVQYTQSGYVLKDGITMKTYIPSNGSDFKKRLVQIAGAKVREYFKEFDLDEHILKKASFREALTSEDTKSIYNSKERLKVKQMTADGYFDVNKYDDCPAISVSQKGKLVLFKKKYELEIANFIQKLKSLRCDVSQLDEFLLNQDLDIDPSKILTMDAVSRYAKEYGIEEGASKVNFERLVCPKGTILDEEGKQKMANMLTVWDDEHCIYVCHPNHIFAGDKLLNSEVRVFENVDWNDIDSKKMFDVGDFGVFPSSDCTEAFRYVHKRLGSQIMKEAKNGNNDAAVSYLAVVEKYPFDYEDYFLVRGIIMGDMDGYLIAFNPEYARIIPTDVWDKSLRISGHNIPQEYCLKRKK